MHSVPIALPLVKVALWVESLGWDGLDGSSHKQLRWQPLKLREDFFGNQVEILIKRENKTFIEAQSDSVCG